MMLGKQLAHWAARRHNRRVPKRRGCAPSVAQKGAVVSTPAAEEPRPVNGLRHSPRRSRARLDTLVRVRRELTRIYTAARDGERDVADASKLGNLLGLLGRMIEGGELERRIEALEARR